MIRSEPKIIQQLSELPRKIKVVIELSCDFIAVTFALVLANIVRLESLTFASNSGFWISAVSISTLTLGCFYACGLYQALVRFITGKIISLVGVGALFSGLFTVVANSFISPKIPTSAILLHVLFVTLGVGGLRFIARQVFRRPVNLQKTRVIIYGANNAGLQLLKPLFHGEEYH